MLFLEAGAKDGQIKLITQIFPTTIISLVRLCACVYVGSTETVPRKAPAKLSKSDF